MGKMRPVACLAMRRRPESPKIPLPRPSAADFRYSSCTSAVLEGSFVTYSNEAKKRMLGVSSDIIDTFGAVSVACAWAMAQGALKHSDADVAVAISGIAGPDGGTPQKPVGLVVFARAVRGSDAVDAEERRFDANTRDGVREAAVKMALELLLPEG